MKVFASMLLIHLFTSITKSFVNNIIPFCFDIKYKFLSIWNFREILNSSRNRSRVVHPFLYQLVRNQLRRNTERLRDTRFWRRYLTKLS